MADEKGRSPASDAARRRFLATIGRSRRQGYTADAGFAALSTSPPEQVGAASHLLEDDEATPGSGWSAPQACAIVGITYRQLDYWARTRLVTPSISATRPAGVRRRYSFDDLVQLKVLKRLLDSSVSLQSARKALEVLRSSDMPRTEARLVLRGSEIVLAQSDEEIVDLVRDSQGVLNILSLGSVEEELRHGIEEVARGEQAQAGDAPASTPRASTA